jgi:RHS repeat-associated protein
MPMAVFCKALTVLLGAGAFKPMQTVDGPRSPLMNRLALSLNRYRYNALDVLVEVESSALVKLRRFYCGNHLATQLGNQSSHSVFQHDRQLLALQSSADARVTSQLLVSDQQRSVWYLTEPAGTVQQVYSPYGHRHLESGSSSLLGFTGEAVDAQTGHYLLGNGHRAFNPVLMRFNSPDSLSPFGRGGLNPYAYCLGDPVNFIDPTGRFGEIAKLVTSLFNLTSARLGLSAALPPYKLAKNALQWGAAGHLPFSQTAAAAGAMVAGVSGVLTALAGVGTAIAGMTGDSETAKTLGFISLGLVGLTVAARAGAVWAGRDPGTIPALRSFVADRRSSPASLARRPREFPATFSRSTPPPDYRSPSPSPPPFPGIGSEGFGPVGNLTLADTFLPNPLNRQPRILVDAKRIRRNSM